MPEIKLEFKIKAPQQICFDLARSIDLHTISTGHTGEKAVAGVTSGLIGLNQTVTWRAKHFGIWQTLTSKITEFDYPHCFVDEMVTGAFNRFRHQHRFRQEGDETRMVDIFDYTAPLGIIGKLADWLVLEKYMKRLLTRRNEIIKEYAETGKWQEILL